MIRPVRADDVPAIVDLIRDLAEYERALSDVEVTAGDLHAALFAASPTVFAHVAEHEGTIAGFVLWFLNFSTWSGRHGIYVEDLYVRPGLRRHGYGTALLNELARICAERGYRRLEWRVLDWNEPAIAFYTSLGAVPMDEWTVFRVTGPTLCRLGESAGAVGSAD